jgi:biotin-(acetyl-CoA carboxylase) ligase
MASLNATCAIAKWFFCNLWQILESLKTKMIITKDFVCFIVIGLGSNLSELKSKIDGVRSDLASIEHPGGPLPEVINTTNVLRLNEYLAKTDEKKSELLVLYEEYVKHLESLVSTLLSIQEDLKDIVKTQVNLLDSEKQKPRPKRTRKRTKN